MNFDSTERQPNMALRLSATFMAIVSCCFILFLPRDEPWVDYVKISACLIASGLYFWSATDESNCNKGWKSSFFLGMIWLFNATINLLVTLASNLPKTE